MWAIDRSIWVALLLSGFYREGKTFEGRFSHCKYQFEDARNSPIRNGREPFCLSFFGGKDILRVKRRRDERFKSRSAGN